MFPFYCCISGYSITQEKDGDFRNDFIHIYKKHNNHLLGDIGETPEIKARNEKYIAMRIPAMRQDAQKLYLKEGYRKILEFEMM